jgi:hypothetical protein
MLVGVDVGKVVGYMVVGADVVEDLGAKRKDFRAFDSSPFEKWIEAKELYMLSPTPCVFPPIFLAMVPINNPKSSLFSVASWSTGSTIDGAAVGASLGAAVGASLGAVFGTSLGAVFGTSLAAGTLIDFGCLAVRRRDL